MRPVVFMAATAGAGGYYAASFYKDARDCEEYTFQYGRNCRWCSDWNCPIGQYRGTCSQHVDAYCRMCTNKPAGNFVYTSPGNENDCSFEPCSTDTGSTTQPLCDDLQDPTNEIWTMENWTPKSPVDLVFYTEMPLDRGTFNTLGDAYRTALSELTGGADVSVGVLETISANVFTRTKKSQAPDNVALQRRQGKAPCAPLPAECTAGDTCPCSECLQVVIIETIVTTTLGNVDDTWSKLNEYDVNAKFREKCLPPVVMKYGELDDGKKTLGGGIIALIVVGSVVPCFIAIACVWYFRRRGWCGMKQTVDEGVQPSSGVELQPDKSRVTA